ncbi:toprim domain-containing protein [uncultured Duncaniella sp.]|uniref:toprim domain-containing protein n=1 Tax=uncultured Duncaniella sp. TaxID=2768039 RepID=UPI00260F247F|nr:toprim domain-containing protein [uncultured Duncaniella sp.]
MAKKKATSDAQIDASLKQYEESIRNYGKDIKSIENFAEGVRKLPGFYIGSKGNVGWKACVREIFQNAVDECIRDNSPCDHIIMSYDERTQEAVISDNGRGVPHEMILTIYASERTSSNYEKKPGQYTSGVHGVGSGVAMALSEHFQVFSYVLGEARQVEFTKGKPWKHGEKVIKCPDGRQGTTVVMRPDHEVLDNVFLTCQEVFNMVFDIFPLIKIGQRIDFTGIDINGKVCINEHLINQDGIMTDLILKTQTPLVAPICFQADTGTMRAAVAFTYDSADLTSDADIKSYANFTNTTEGGTHVDGFISGLTSYIRTYMNNIFLGEKSKLKITNADIMTGLKVIIDAAHLNPVFKGQFKGILSNEDMVPFMRDLTKKSMEEWAKRNPNELQKVCKFIKEIAEIRVKSDNEKINISKNYVQSSLNRGMPKKFIAPSGKKNLEFFIVEGDSALGPTRNSRDTTCQGIFPIRGKLPNAFRTSKAAFLKNAEVSSIMKISTGGKYGNELDVERDCPWEKIVFLSDADPDGAHIDTLLLRMFVMYLWKLIEAGRVYRAVPPLFGIKTGKRMTYFSTKLDFTKYMQNLFSKQYELATDAGVKITGQRATVIFFKNVDYVHMLEVIGNTFAIDPTFLEDILYYLKDYVNYAHASMAAHMAGSKIAVRKPKGTKKVKKPAEAKKPKAAPAAVEDGGDIEILDMEAMLDYDGMVGVISPTFDLKKFIRYLKKKYKYIDGRSVNGTILLQGLVGNKYHYVFLNDKFLSACMDMINLIKSNDEDFYRINGELCTIYKLMKTFESLTPTGLTRYKGLGEQNDEQLGESTLRPDSDRTLIRYTMESALEEIEMMKAIDSSMGRLLKEIKMTRSDIE